MRYSVDFLKTLKYKVKYNHWLPSLLRAYGTVVNNTIYYALEEESVPDHIHIHELVHVAQYKRDGVVKFLIIYFTEYIQNYFIYKDWYQAYINIRYEKEAMEIEQYYREQYGEN